MGSNTRSSTISKYATGFSIISIVAIFVVGLVVPKGLNWFFVMFFMICFIVSIGWLRTGRLSGIFINERNLMSLSRFQLVLWTIIVLSAFLTIALIRISASMADPDAITDPLAIALPEQLWTLLGISTASLVGSPLILSTKVQKEPTPKQQEGFIAKKVAKFDKENAKIIAANFIKGKKLPDEQFREKIFENTTIQNEINSLADRKKEVEARLQTLAQSKKRKATTANKLELKNIQAKELELEEKKENIAVGVKKIRDGAESSGILNYNVDIKDASFSDLFQGDEEANCKHIDMAKVQMFFFTLIIAFSYMVLLVNLILTSDAPNSTVFQN